MDNLWRENLRILGDDHILRLRQLSAGLGRCLQQYVGNGPTWFFDPMESKYSAPIFQNSKGFLFDQLDLMIAVSKYLPEWAYIYLAPKEVKISETDDLKMPLILNKGKVHLFITAEDS